MSKPTVGMIQRIRQLYLTSRLPWKRHILAGTDLDGNEFYEMPNPNGGRAKRWIEFKDKVGYSDYDQNHIPVQWSAWLRHTRLTPPTLQEIEVANRRRDLTIQRAKELDRLWEERKYLKSELKIQIAGSERVPPLTAVEEPKTKGKIQENFHPKGQGDTFQPESWVPNVTSRH